MPSSPPSTALYTIADFITRYAWKLQYLDHSIKTKLLRIEAIQNDPSQDQKRRDLYLSLGNSEVRLREVEDKIEDLFRLKIANGK
ncbi:hypothetical protein BG015_011159 [Linnemannia schmuckeri]|uniref:Uncharacterized protein n=1 Tax=Linnemannia schmuckeri TaxID=64567 RepID=A0A9P5V8D3_9FUNG|nr:hypothetical protein BG015_011159 [Linnemannia schmuckeri]